MRYMGGKSKIRKEIAALMTTLRRPDQLYVEPFVGGAWVLQEVDGVRIASDKNTALITMYAALQNGWVPPDSVSENEYTEYKMLQNPNDPMTAFVGFGCSFAGKWFGGYARSGDENYAVITKNSLLKQIPLIRDVIFTSMDYSNIKVADALIYCDPPYATTTAYGAVGSFDSDAFWETMREWSKLNTVIISEYSAPPDFACIAEFKSKMGLRQSDGTQEVRSEKVFMLCQ